MDKDVDILKSKVTQILKRDISNNMSLIPEEEMMLYDSVCETTNEKDYSIIDYQIGFSPISDSFNSSLYLYFLHSRKKQARKHSKL